MNITNNNMNSTEQSAISHIHQQNHDEDQKYIEELKRRNKALTEQLHKTIEHLTTNNSSLLEKIIKTTCSSDNSLLDFLKKWLVKATPNQTPVNQLLLSGNKYYPVAICASDLAEDLSAPAEKARQEIEQNLVQRISDGDFHSVFDIADQFFTEELYLRSTYYITPCLRGKVLSLFKTLFKKLLETNQVTTVIDHFKDSGSEILGYILRGMHETITENNDTAVDIISSINKLNKEAIVGLVGRIPDKDGLKHDRLHIIAHWHPSIHRDNNLQSSCFGVVVSALLNKKASNSHEVILMLLEHGVDPNILLNTVTEIYPMFKEHYSQRCPTLVRLLHYFGATNYSEALPEDVQKQIEEASSILSQAKKSKAAQESFVLITLDALGFPRELSSLIHGYNGVVDLCIQSDPILQGLNKQPK